MLNKIKELRKSNGLTQAQLASKIGVSQPTLSLLEKDGNSLEDMLPIAQYFGVSLDYLVSGHVKVIAKQDYKTLIDARSQANNALEFLTSTLTLTNLSDEELTDYYRGYLTIVPSNEDSYYLRFKVKSINNGYLRVDTTTGSMSFVPKEQANLFTESEATAYGNLFSIEKAPD